MKSQRLYLLDIVRIFFIMAIINFHAYSFIFLKEHDPENFPFQFTNVAIAFFRNFTIGGFFVVGVSSFLYGLKLKERMKLKSLFVLLVSGALLLMVTQGETAFTEIYLEWDIYHYLMVGFLSLFFLSKFERAILPFGAVGFFLLWIPFWKFESFNSLPIMWQHILIGVCDDEGRGGWALLPWMGLFWLCFSIGVYSQKNLQALRRSPQWSVIALFVILFLLSIPQLSVYHRTPIGPGFSCYMHRQEPLVFWSHFIIILMVFRLSLVDRINQKLHEFSFFRFVSGLMWSKNFGLCYMIQIFYISLGTLFVDVFWLAPWSFDIFLISVLPVSELLARGIKRLYTEFWIEA